MKSSCAFLLATVFLVISAGSAHATAPVAPSATGYDISFPQCSESLPPSPGFGVVGVNAGHTFSVNPCLDRELTWATSAVNPIAAFYANTQNPGPAGPGWPTNQSTPKVCHGANSVACSYDYGWNAARAAFANAVNAEHDAGVAVPSATATASPWWLDVETGNKWETIERASNGATQSYDRASLEGMIASFTNIGVTSLGIYSTDQQWTVINGTADADIPAVPVWLAGYSSLATAQAGCSTASFSGGRVAMTQYGSRGFDGDYRCGLLSTPVTTSVSVAASSTFSSQIATTNNDGAVTYVQTSGTPDLLVSATGLVTTSGALPIGTYVATGTTTDASGDEGTFSLTLDVGVLLQGSPTAASVKASGSAKYSTQLNVTGNTGATSFTESVGSPSLVVNSTGLLTTSGPLAAGSYTASGSMTDPSGDQGTFTFTLKVGALVQRVPTTGTVTTADVATFSQQLNVGANLGPVSYVQTSGAPNLVVSATGVVTTSGALPVGTDVARGTTSDTTGDVGTFVFTLKVSATPPPPPPTPPPSTKPAATVTSGHAVAGRTVTLEIHGKGFFGRPLVTSHAGTYVAVTRDTGRVLVVRVTVRAHSRNGVFTFTITFSSGDSCTVRYNQRP